MKKRLARQLLWKNLFLSIEYTSLAVAGPTHRIKRKDKPVWQLSYWVAAVLLFSSVVWNDALAEKFSINDAISQAVLTNPGVGEASANRRATETELRQTQSTLLPQVRLEARVGPERFDQQIVPPPIGNGQWLNGKAGSVVVRQLLFDGFASIHDIWRQAARVNAASFRVRERSELIALDAAEAYIDVVRFLRRVALANQKVIVPVCVVTGKPAVSPACEPADSPGPRLARSAASFTVVSAPPVFGITMLLGNESLIWTVNCADEISPSPSLIV